MAHLAETDLHPNIIVVICDDLGWGDLSCHGNPHLQTPCLDRFAQQSSRLTRYCSGPLCTPARAALMTGRHPYRTRAIDTYLGRSMIDPGERTLPAILKDAGYRTGIFGKWHLGDCHPTRAIDMGFDESLVHHGGGLRQPGNIGRDSYFSPDLMHNGELKPSQGYCTDLFTDAAIQFIDQTSRQPFFCYLAFNAPHSPLEIGDEWVTPYRDQGLPEPTARFYGMVANIDANVGRLLHQLEQKDLAENTVVVFTSDHGQCASSFPTGGSRYNSGLRGSKGQMYEGGVRVPCFLRYPKHFVPGEMDRLTNPIDLLPTLVEMCSANLPSDRVIDGVSLAPLLTGKLTPADWPDRVLCMQWHRGDKPIPHRNAAAITQRWKWYHPQGAPHAELYDLQQDPFEKNNCLADHPDIARRLEQAYDQWFADVSNTRPDNYDPVRITLGHPAQPVAVLTWQDWRLYADVQENGWDKDHPGYWEVRVHQAGRYHITIDFPSGSNGEANFCCADASFSSPLGRNIQSVSFTTSLPQGDFALEAFLRDQDRRSGARCVWITCAAEINVDEVK